MNENKKRQKQFSFFIVGVIRVSKITFEPIWKCFEKITDSMDVAT